MVKANKFSLAFRWSNLSLDIEVFAIAVMNFFAFAIDYEDHQRNLPILIDVHSIVAHIICSLCNVNTRLSSPSPIFKVTIYMRKSRRKSFFHSSTDIRLLDPSNLMDDLFIILNLVRSALRI